MSSFPTQLTTVCLTLVTRGKNIFLYYYSTVSQITGARLHQNCIIFSAKRKGKQINLFIKYNFSYKIYREGGERGQTIFVPKSQLRSLIGLERLWATFGLDSNTERVIIQLQRKRSFSLFESFFSYSNFSSVTRECRGKLFESKLNDAALNE